MAFRANKIIRQKPLCPIHLSTEHLNNLDFCYLSYHAIIDKKRQAYVYSTESYKH